MTQKQTPYATGHLGYDGLATTTPEVKVVEIAIDDILVPSDMRPLDGETVDRLAESIRELGLQPES